MEIIIGPVVRHSLENARSKYNTKSKEKDILMNWMTKKTEKIGYIFGSCVHDIQ